MTRLPVFLVSKDFGYRLLASISDRLQDAVVLHPDDSPDERSVLPLFRTLCENRGFQFHVTPNKSLAEKIIKETFPEILFVCGWYWILPQSTLDAPRKGAFGFHNSLLPKYRGGAPLVWSIINGDEEVGTSLFRFGRGVDDGEIVKQFAVPLDRTENVADALKKIQSAVLTDFSSLFSALLDGDFEAWEQDEAAATYVPQRKPEDGRINWSWPAGKIHDFCRAQAPPYPGAFCFYGSAKLFIHATIETDEICDSAAGTILEVQEDRLHVSCGDGTTIWLISILENGVGFSIEEYFSDGPRKFR